MIDRVNKASIVFTFFHARVVEFLSAALSDVYCCGPCGGIFSSLVCMEGRESAGLLACLWVSLCPDRSVLKGVKELILASRHLREVLEAMITIVTMTQTDSSP